MSDLNKNKEYEYDIVLSFAGEDREHAEKLALYLKAYSINVFYDKWEQSKLWGENLYDYLANVYSKKAKYCVLFISNNYAKKLWTNHERQMAQARAFKEKEAYILPIRLDSTEIPGIPETIGYIELNQSINLLDVALLILQKLDKKIKSSKVEPTQYLKSAIKGALQLDADNLFYHKGRYDSEKWKHHFSILQNTKWTIADFGELIVPALTNELLSNSHRYLKRNLLEILERIGSNKSTVAICEVSNHMDAKVRNLAMLALQKIRDEPSIPALRNSLRYNDTFVRRNAVVALKSIGSKETIKDLMYVVERERDPFVQAHAVEGLGAIGTEELNHSGGIEMNMLEEHVKQF